MFAIRWTEATICSMEAEVWVTEEAWLWVLLATFWMFADISCIVAVVSSTAVAAASLFRADCSAVDAICAEAEAIWSAPARISPMVSAQAFDHLVEGIAEHVLSGRGRHSLRRSPAAISSAVSPCWRYTIISRNDAASTPISSFVSPPPSHPGPPGYLLRGVGHLPERTAIREDMKSPAATAQAC